MTATRKIPAKKSTANKPVARTSAKKSTVKRAPARRTTARRRTASRRPRPALSTTIGGAIGAFLVTTLLDLSWPVRIALIVAVLILGLGYIFWKSRAARAAAPADQPGDPAGLTTD